MFRANNESRAEQLLITTQCHTLANDFRHEYSGAVDSAIPPLPNPIRSAPVESVESQQDLRTGRSEVVTSVQADAIGRGLTRRLCV